MSRFAARLLVLILAAALPAQAQDSWRPSPSAREQMARMSLDDLFARLAASPEQRSAKALETEILRRLNQSGSATADLLYGRAMEAMREEDLGLALDLLDRIVLLKPDFVEGWNKRATIHFMRKDPGKAIADLERVLMLEPRHFGALAGLGVILRDLGREADAAEAFRQALALHPHMEQARTILKRLETRGGGQPI